MKCVICGLDSEEGRYVDGSWDSDKNVEEEYKGKYVCWRYCFVHAWKPEAKYSLVDLHCDEGVTSICILCGRTTKFGRIARIGDGGEYIRCLYCIGALKKVREEDVESWKVWVKHNR